MMSEDAVIVVNESLRQRLRTDREKNLSLFLDMKEVLAGPEVNVPLKYGTKITNRSLGVTADTRKNLRHLDGVIQGLEQCFPEYKIEINELWLGWNDETAPSSGTRLQFVAPHNDAGVYLKTGVSVPVQIWVLLESCVIGSTPPVDVAKNKNALECYLPICNGVMFPGMTKAITPEGPKEWMPQKTVGGDDMMIGDILLFKTGVVRRSTPAVGNFFRAALGLVAILKSDLDQIDDNFRLWFKEVMESQKDILKLDVNSPYFSRMGKLLADLPEKPVDYSRLKKKDNNDFDGLIKRLQSHRFGV